LNKIKTGQTVTEMIARIKGMKTISLQFWLICVLTLYSCVPGTYYDPFDEFTRGVRLFDRRQFPEAMNQWKPLAESGNCRAQYWLGTLYFQGLGTDRNYVIAREWWQKAATQGHIRSQVDLGATFFHGKTPSEFCPAGCDVEMDVVQAYKWHLIANRAASGDLKTFTDKSLEIIRKKMSPAEISAAEVLASRWTAKPVNCHQ
jgi:hypothetical protein